MLLQFGLNINSDQDDFRPDNGLGIDQLGKLLLRLNGAIIDKDDIKSILSGVENHGYTPHFVTQSADVYANFINVHRKISERGLNDLTVAEAKYAGALKSILKEGTYIQPIDKEDRPILKLYPQDIAKEVAYFHSIKWVRGILTEIGTTNIKYPSHIYIQGLSYKIYISPEQDAELNRFYKDAVLELKVNQKLSVKTGNVINAVLLSFKVQNNISLHEALGSLNPEDITFTDGENRYTDIIRSLSK